MASQSIQAQAQHREIELRPIVKRLVRFVAWRGWTKVFGTVAIGAMGATGIRAAIDQTPLANYPWELVGCAVAATAWSTSHFVQGMIDVATDRDHPSQ